VRACCSTAYPGRIQPDFPIEEFDFIITDECHRSIYNLGGRCSNTSTPHSSASLRRRPNRPSASSSKTRHGIQPEKPCRRRDVGCDIYRINTAITRAARRWTPVLCGQRDRQTRRVRWEQLDEVLSYDASALDRDVVARTRCAPCSPRSATRSSLKSSRAAPTCPKRSSSPRTTPTPTTSSASAARCSARATTLPENHLPHWLRPHRGKEAAVRRQGIEEITWKRASSLSPEEI